MGPFVVRKSHLALFGLAVHMAAFSVLPQRVNESPDYTDYYEIGARNLLAGNGYSNQQGRFIVRYPPGFSLILAPVFALCQASGLPESRGLDLMIAGCGIVTMLFLFLTGELLFSRRVGLLAAILWTTYPFYLYLTKQPNPESPFLVFFAASVYAWARTLSGGDWRWAIASGLAAGCGTLIRPINLLLPALLAITVAAAGGQARRRSRILPAALLLAASFVPLLPWEIAVRQRTGEWILVSSNSAYSTFDGLTFALEPKGSGQLLEVDPEVRWLMQQVWDHRTELPTTGSMIRFVGSHLHEKPGAVIKLFLLKTTRAWYATQAQWHERVIAAIQVPYLLLIGFGLWRCWTLYPARRHDYLALSILATAYWWGMAVLALPILRYMVPAFWLLLIPAAVFLERFLPKRVA